MKIAICDHAKDSDFFPDSSSPWNGFFEALRDGGHTVVSIHSSPDIFISMNHHESLQKKMMDINPKLRSFLVLWEPEVTRPSNFNRGIEGKYEFIFTPSRKWISGSNIVDFKWPQGGPQGYCFDKGDWESRSRKIAIVLSNKYSFVKGELYSFRRKVIGSFRDEIVVFGLNWESRGKMFIQLAKSFLLARRFYSLAEMKIPESIFTKPRIYCGSPSDKKVCLRKFRYSLVIENSIDYVSEKLFESLASGNLVLYVGPPLQEFGIPKVAIECKPNIKDVAHAIQRLRYDEDYCINLLQTASDFMNHEEYSKFRNELVLKELGLAISKIIDTKEN